MSFFIALAFRVKAIADCCSTKLGKEREIDSDHCFHDNVDVDNREMGGSDICLSAH